MICLYSVFYELCSIMIYDIDIQLNCVLLWSMIDIFFVFYSDLCSFRSMFLWFVYIPWWCGSILAMLNGPWALKKPRGNSPKLSPLPSSATKSWRPASCWDEGREMDMIWYEDICIYIWYDNPVHIYDGSVGRWFTNYSL